MTREEAIRIFRKEIECLSHTKCSDCRLKGVCDPISTTPLDSEYIEAFGMAIEALSAECEDTISRQAVMDFIRGLTRWCVRSEDGKFNNVGLLYDDVMFGLDRLPSVTPKQKMGRWITKIKSDLRGDVWPTNPKCSECGGEPYYHNTIYNYKFCPYCGTKMEAEPYKAESED